MLQGVNVIAKNTIYNFPQEDYFKIPENGKLFVDVLIKNAHVIDSSLKDGEAIGVLYKEVLKDGVVAFEPLVDKKGNLIECYGHVTYDCLNETNLKELRQQSFYQRIKG
ncbi:hypothetical protein [Zobellia laminariae]|uniref:hypothetical protein n=1 Tax=Zobellia laminariae TaxID=248906 RepID=UPI0026F453C2|nr:hypothetical protein [Zobellia laminariae]WKX76111.1 hypothetical protein Q5W13_21480 [Zobellia laminariae]